MIAQLEGKLVKLGPGTALIMTSGVGYMVHISLSLQDLLSKKEGETVIVHTHLAIRENSQELFGFDSEDERDFFEMLIKISGIGPRSALSIISVAPLETLKDAIASGDTSYLTKVSGIGRKTANKVVLELKDELASNLLDDDGAKSSMRKEDMDALEALKALGYASRESREILKEIDPSITTVEARIKEALKKLNGN